MQHILYNFLQDNSSCPLHQQQFCPICVCEIPVESACGGACLGPPGANGFSGHCNLSELDTFGFWTFDIQDLATSCTELLYFTFWFVFSVLNTKMQWKERQFSRCIRLFESFPHNWVITEYWSAISTPFMHLLHWKTTWGFYIFRSVFFFFLVFPFCVYYCCNTDHAYDLTSLLSFHPWTIMLPGMLTVLISSGWFRVLQQAECPLLALVVPQTLAFLPSNVSATLTLI